jgi:hypothetical protein
MPAGNEFQPEISWRQVPPLRPIDRCRKFVAFFNAIKAYGFAHSSRHWSRDVCSQGLVVVIGPGNRIGSVTRSFFHLSVGKPLFLSILFVFGDGPP